MLKSKTQVHLLIELVFFPQKLKTFLGFDDFETNQMKKAFNAFLGFRDVV